MLYPVLSYLHPLTLCQSYLDTFLSSELQGFFWGTKEESVPAETSREADIGSVPTETAEEAANQQETSVHPETAV